MIVALLVLIALILLFGAGVVKGWLSNAIGLVLGGGAIVLTLVWLGSYLGENGPFWLFIGIGVLLFIGSIWARSQPKI